MWTENGPPGGRWTRTSWRSSWTHPFFRVPPPRSTGRETFGDAFLDRVVARMPPRDSRGWDDLLATLTALTAESVARAFADHLPAGEVHEVVLAGGGARNPALVRALPVPSIPSPSAREPTPWGSIPMPGRPRPSPSWPGPTFGASRGVFPGSPGRKAPGSWGPSPLAAGGWVGAGGAGGRGGHDLGAMVTPERRSLLLAGGLLVPVVAGVLASVLTPAPHTGGDNAAYLALGHALEQGLGYVELWEPGVPPHTKYPPAFPLLLAGLMALGASAWGTFKGAMAVLVAVGVLLVFAWTAHRRGPLAGLAVALLTLLSAGWLDAGRWILSEPLFLPLTFLALWAADRGGAVWPGGGGGPGMGDAAGDGTRFPSSAQDGTRRPSAAQDGTRHPSTDRRGAWLAVAGVAALLALLTRSAGLPLVLALGGALLLARRRRGAALFGGVAAGVAGGWALRARQGGEGAYQSEFWMRNPYEPELGTLGVGELPLRVWENLGIYLGGVLPGEWWPGGGVGHLVLGVGLVGAALAGWVLRLRRGEVGTAELFLPLYAGLILLWPPVWSGDRFALPLYPLFLLYAGEALVAGARLAWGGWHGAPRGTWPWWPPPRHSSSWLSPPSPGGWPPRRRPPRAAGWRRRTCSAAFPPRWRSSGMPPPGVE
jgi:hypothetical protein